MSKTRLNQLSLMGIVALVTACVTINVYFPEAAAEKAADQFIDNVIGPTMTPDEQASLQQPSTRFSLLDLIFPAAHAQSVNIDINTPEIVAIQNRMSARFNSELAAFFDQGAIGYDQNAMIAIRDLSVVGLKDRNTLKSAVSADNADRKAVYREIAVANGHPEWEDQIRQTFAERWISRAKAGWYYQSADGSWTQK